MKNNLLIKDEWEDFDGKYLTVEVAPKKYVDVKSPKENPDFIYVMDCSNGYEVYEEGSDGGVENLTPNQYEEVLEIAKGRFYPVKAGA